MLCKVHVHFTTIVPITPAFYSLLFPACQKVCWRNRCVSIFSVTSYFTIVNMVFSFTANLFCMVNSTDLVVKEDTYCYH